jgi:hypothetical protein
MDAFKFRKPGEQGTFFFKVVWHQQRKLQQKRKGRLTMTGSSQLTTKYH